MADISEIFKKARALSAREATPEEQLADAMVSAGIDPPDHFIFDGALHRFASESGRKKKTGWYIVFPDGVPAGRFGCWRQDIDCVFRADVRRELTATEQMMHANRIAAAKELRDRERARMAEIVADVVADIWESAAIASEDHPYLTRKNVRAHGLRITGDGRLMVPMYRGGELVSIQYISEVEKLFHNGAPTAGACFIVGGGQADYIAEGYSTAATIHEATGKAVAVAFNASNIPAVAAALRAEYGIAHPLCIVADRDKLGTGEKYANRAAEQSGCRVIVSPVDSDVNDYAAQGGDVLALLEPPDSWLVSADSMCEQPAPIRWLIKRWIQAESLIMVHGPSGAGKTFVVLDMAARISAGVADWRGHRVTPGAVVYLAGEGHHGLRSRLAAWKQEHQRDIGKMWLSKSGCDLNTAMGYMQIVEHVRMLPDRPCLIVVDTLHRFLSGDENSAQDAKTMLDACAGLMREFGCAVLLVHHTGVSDESQHRARGSSAWRGALEVEISVAKNTIEQKKMKDAEMLEPLHFELKSIEINGWLDEDGEQVTSAVCIESDAPVKAKPVDKKLREYQKTIEAAWWGHGGRQIMDGYPYVTRAALRAKLGESGKAERTIENEINPAYPGKIINQLLESEFIEPVDHGWIITDPAVSSVMILESKNNGGNDNIQ